MTSWESFQIAFGDDIYGLFMRDESMGNGDRTGYLGGFTKLVDTL